MHNPLKSKIQDKFGAHAEEYEEAANVQKSCINSLIEIIRKIELPSGPILELGSGTGLLSLELARLFPERNLELTDLCPIMVKKTQNKLKKLQGNHFFYQLDGESVAKKNHYSAIFSSFAFQWFEDLEGSLLNLVQALKPGGVLLAAMPENGSYPEWKQACSLLGLPFGGNPLPDATELNDFLAKSKLSYRLFVESHPVGYPSPLAFFHHFKMLGATTQTRGNPLEYGDFKRLLRALGGNREFVATTKTLILKIIK